LIRIRSWTATYTDGRDRDFSLSTVYGIVRQNRGFIDVASKPGQGTTFYIYLPSHSEALPQPAPNERIRSAPRPEKR
jgi:signal transduction histidine kinase